MTECTEIIYVNVVTSCRETTNNQHTYRFDCCKFKFALAIAAFIVVSAVNEWRFSEWSRILPVVCCVPAAAATAAGWTSFDKLFVGLLGAVLDVDVVLLDVLEFGLVVTVELESVDDEFDSIGVGGTFLVDMAYWTLFEKKNKNKSSYIKKKKCA